MNLTTKNLASNRTSAAETDESTINEAIDLGEPRPIDPSNEIPDGGLKAWLQVAGSFVLFFNTWGLINSYGVFQTIYETTILSSESDSRISWIGSTQGCLNLFTSIAAGHLYDTGRMSLLLSVGTVFTVLGMMMTSICNEYWQFFLAQGVLVGVGGGFLFVPSVAIMAQYFAKRRAFATGIASLGSGIGGMVFPVLVRQLDSAIGFRWAVRVVAFVMLAASVIPLACMRQRYLPVTSKKSLFTAIFHWPYVSFCFAIFFGYMGTYVVLFYIQLYATQHPDISRDVGDYVVTIVNTSSLVGRIMACYFADKLGPLNVSIPCTLSAGLLAFFWIGAGSTASIVAVSVLFGFMAAAFWTLPSPTVISLSNDMSSVGLQIGLMEGFAGTGVLIGTPIAGALLGNRHWVSVQAFAGASITAAVLLVLCARLLKTGGKARAKA